MNQISNVIENLKIFYNTAISPIVVTSFQFGLWYLFIHSLYWGLEQVRYNWCVSHGISGFLHSLLVSQSLFCGLLTETSKALSNTQINNLTLISSFIGVKCLTLLKKG